MKLVILEKKRQDMIILYEFFFIKRREALHRSYKRNNNIKIRMISKRR